MIFVLDNYDSFTYNLVQRLGEINSGLEIRVARNDRITVAKMAKLAPQRLIVSPGPGTPEQAGISREAIAYFAPRIPVLGVCLGHQCIAEVFGMKVMRTDHLMHGKTSMIYHDGAGVFDALENPFEATRYHSLIVPPNTLPPELELCAWAQDAGHPREIMGLRHRKHAVHGVQFHPESFLTLEGTKLLTNFLKLPVAQPAA